MLIKPALCGLALVCLVRMAAYAQSSSNERPANTPASGDLPDKVINLPSRLLSKLQSRTQQLDQQLTQQTTSYLQKIQKREARMRKKLSAIDSAGAEQLFQHSDQQYAALVQQLKTDTGNPGTHLGGSYLPNVDSMRVGLDFLNKNSSLVNGAGNANRVGNTVSQFRTLQAKMIDADQVKAYLQLMGFVG